MGQPTSITVGVDKTNYSRYETDKNTVNVVTRVSGGATYSNEVVYVELVKARRSRDMVVGTTSVTFNGATDSQTASSSFALNDLVDQDMINLVRHGKYFIRSRSLAREASSVIGSVDAAPVTISTVDTGTDTNSWTVSVVVPGGTSALSVTIAGTVVTVSLATSAGVPVTSANTREKIVSFINSLLVTNISASFTGTANLSLSTASGPTTFSGGRDEVSGESSDFIIRIITPDRLRKDYLFGIPPYAGDVRMIRFQPANITGVTVDELSRQHSFGVFPLTYNYVDTGTTISRTLSWNGGPIISINNAGTYVLRRGGQPTVFNNLISQAFNQDYIIVTVGDSTLLPTVNAVDELLIESMKLDDDTLGRFLDNAVDWVENDALMTYIEPTKVVTDRDPTTIQFAAGINAPTPLFTDPDWDFIKGALTYFVPRGSDWIDVQTPFTQILRVDNLFGSIANTRVIDIDLDWIQAYPQGGLIQLVPFNQTIAFDFLGLIWVNAISGAAAIPSFWHYNFIVGLRDTPGDIQELIAKKAALDVLLALGAALRPGVGSTSLGRDGVSQSVSYATSLKYGPYTGIIQGYMDWMDKNLPTLRAVYRGNLIRFV